MKSKKVIEAIPLFSIATQNYYNLNLTPQNTDNNKIKSRKHSNLIPHTHRLPGCFPLRPI